jgi:hypothetical protein
MSKLSLGLFTICFGLLPLWISIVWFTIELLKWEPGFSEAGGWILFGGAAASVYTCGVVFLTAAVYDHTEGTPRRKTRQAWLAFFVLCAATITFLGLGLG